MAVGGVCDGTVNIGTLDGSLVVAGEGEGRVGAGDKGADRVVQLTRQTIEKSTEEAIVDNRIIRPQRDRDEHIRDRPAEWSAAL